MPAAMAGLMSDRGLFPIIQVLGRKSMALDQFLKNVDALFPHNLDRLEEARQTRSLNFSVLLDGASFGEQDGMVSLAQELQAAVNSLQELNRMPAHRF